MTSASVVALILVASGGILMALRLIVGPTLPDRILAADALVTLITISVGLYIVFYPDEADAFVDVMLIISVLGFLGTVAFARFVEQRLAVNGEDDEES